MRTIGYRMRLIGGALAGVILVACQAGGGSPSAGSPSTGGPAGASPPAASAGGETKNLVIGFTTSQTGALNVESTRQKDGLQLWIDDVNKDGGIKLSDGTAVTFTAKTYDDESKGDRVQELYTKLINDDKADFLISPYSSGLADTSAVIAEQYEKIMITTGAASDGTYKKGYAHVYQTYTPASRYLTGAADLLKNLEGSAKSIAIVHENDKFSTDVATALNDYATQQGYQIVVNEGYDTGTTDFAAFVNKVVAASPDAVMGGGHFADTSTFAKQLFDKGVKAKMIALLVAPPEPKFADIGDAAMGVIGPSQWEPTVKFSEDAAKSAGLTWLGPTVDDFVSRYKAAYTEDPSYHSAGGYAAGLILQAAITAAGSTDPEAVRTAMDGLALETFFGLTKFETSAEAHGLQVAHEMVYVQWQGSAGSLGKQVVWPEAAKTADAVYPIH
jgi:ABC-type branched-subunit amino acid transport system substrate-binding protein